MQKRERQQQWKLVEHVVAALFNDPDVDVRSNVRLPAVRKQAGRGQRREIDVLVTGQVAGQRVHIPIECKHLRRKVGSPEIDSFIGRLLDIGLATQTSIFVSTSGFSVGAVERARQVGMRTLVLSGANLDRTRELLLEAVQSHVYMCCHLAKLQFESPDVTPGEHDLTFFTSDGTYRGSLQDFLWQAWLNGAPPLVCGRYAYDVEVPSEWMYSIDRMPKQIQNIHVEYEVFAMVKEYIGCADWHRLQDADSGSTERQAFSLDFTESSGVQVPQQFDTEEELDGYLRKRAGAARLTVGRHQLPKLAMHQGLLWPIPAEVMEQLQETEREAWEAQLAVFREGATNNFWAFDDVYASVLKAAQAGAWVQMTQVSAQGP